ncbi:hypothetical protein [Neisseria sp. HMSC064E01]|jgi:putative lipoprotein|uniref:hypothetical protein n=1 Tax=Neisseria sp. HMSC064E01 TaxID=1715052 RepID=UPI0008A4F464|nr:hypothetical protein [Neisseria sp. HMSC064E01]OFN80786.1 hypothetical protein HMPREF2572_05750 [Neisseria sp. HMSC064E01]
MRRFSYLIALSSVLAISACANNQSQSSAGASGSASSHEQHAKASGACRSAGEGRKVNGKGKNDIYMCKASVALNSAEAKSVLNPNIKVSYGSTGNKTLVSRQIANMVGKSPEESCQRAFLSTVKRFQSTAVEKNAKSVHLVSYFDKKTVGGDEYECHVATWNSRVVLKGSLH